MSTKPSVGKHVVIEDDVTFGNNVVIGHNTVILKGTRIGNNVEIGANCVIGIIPGGNNRMRQQTLHSHSLLIGDHTKLGNMVSIYLNTSIAENVFIGDHASIRENVTIGKGTVIGRNAIVELNTRIGENCTIQTLSYITGDTILEDDVFIGPCVSMANDKYMGAKDYVLKGPHLKKGVKIGNNATILPAVTIGTGTIVGGGSVVTKDIGEHLVVAGVPARKLL